MPIFDVWDTLKVPFPYTDRPVRQRRPALVIATGGQSPDHCPLRVLMITSVGNRGWPSDVAITDLTTAGLPVPSVIRTAKIAVIMTRDDEHLGVLSHADRMELAAQLRRHLSAALIGS